MKKLIYLFLLLTAITFADTTENLFDAVKKLDTSSVKVAIENNANINAKDLSGNTPLDYLISDYDLETETLKNTDVNNSDMQKKYEIAKLLITEDANINITKNFGNRILFYIMIKMSLANIQFVGEPEREALEINNDINFFNLIVDTGIDLKSMDIKLNKMSLNLIDFAVQRMAVVNTALEKENGSPGLEKITEILIDKKLVTTKMFRTILLFYAVRLDNQKIVGAILDSGENVNAMIGDEFPTYLAAKNNSVEMLKFLKSKGGYLNGVNKKDESPILAAVENSSLDAVKYLIENGCSVDEASSDKIYLIMRAIKYSNYPENKAGKEIAKILLEDESVDVNCTIDTFNDYFDNMCAFSPLSIATDLDILKLLVDKGAYVDMKSNTGSTALMNTINVDKVEFLLENGANINEVDNSNNTALMNLLKNFNDGIVFLDLTYLNEDNISLIAKLLLEKGLDPKVVNDDGYDAFLYSVELNFKNLAELLLEKGADIKRKNSKGENALLLSARAGNYDISKLLIEKGLKVNTVNNDGTTPLMQATLSGNIELVKLLIEKGADLGAKNSSGYTALEIAKSNSSEELVEVLIKSGEK